MTLTSYARTLRRQWTLVVLIVGLVGLAAAAWTVTRPPTYQSTTKMFVSARTSDSSIADLSQGSDFTQERVKSYTSIITSSTLLAEVIKQVGLTSTTGELARHISATNPVDSVLLQVTVTDEQPQRAADIANAVAGLFPAFVADLETPRGRTTSPVLISQIQPALAGTAPVSPNVGLNLGLGLVLGLALGAGAAVLRESSNTTVRSARELEELTGLVPLGEVPYDSAAGRQPLVDMVDSAGRAEAFRTLRTNLQFVNIDQPPRIIVVTSGLPDEGKTTTACNLALTISLSGHRVVLVDGDLRRPSVGRYLGVSNGAGLTSVLSRQHELRDVLVTYRHEALSVLPAGPTPPNPSELLGSQLMAALLAQLTDQFDIVVVDAPPVLPVTDAAVLAAQADGALLVVRYGRSRREETLRALQALRSVNARMLGSVLNRVPRSRTTTGYGPALPFGTAAAATPAHGVALGPHTGRASARRSGQRQRA